MILKILLVIIIIIIFYLVINFNIEKFNINNNYRSIEENPWDRNDIYSLIPYDIKAKKNDLYFYEYGNDEYEKKLNEIFNNKCTTENLILILEGNNWSNWINPSKSNNNYLILDYYNKIYNFIYNKINDSDILKLPNNTNNNIKIIKDKLINIKNNLDDTSYYMFDIELLLYRDNKPLGKHVKFIVISNNINIYIIYIKIIGVINENNIKNTIYDNYNKKEYNEYIPSKLINYNLNSYIYEGSDKLLNSDINNILYNKLYNNLNC